MGLVWGRGPAAAPCGCGGVAMQVSTSGSAQESASEQLSQPPHPACAAYALNGFTTSKLAFSPTASGTAAGGVIWASFSLPWPGGAAPTIRINYGTGPYSGGSATGVDGMAKHSVTPPTACVAAAGTMPATC